MLLVLAFLLGLSLAQRPSDSSICDYYAETQFGNNTNVTQANLIKGIVALAFGGPVDGLANISTDLTGILNPGKYGNTPVNLMGYFNGSMATTNLNNAPVGIDWLDGGATQPLNDFLTGKTSTVVLTNTTNQYRLFSHFFVAFSHVFACSHPINPPPVSTGIFQELNLAYVHKYMDLNYTDLAHFINQFGKASLHFGFSDQDVQTFTGVLNSEYNTRCSPAITLDPHTGPQLLSLCQDPSCPLAAPSPDCNAYTNLQAVGYSANVSSTSAPSTVATATPLASTTSSTSSVVTSAPAQTTDPDAASNKSVNSSGSNLSGGAIAGIAIGAAVVVLMAVGLGLFFFKKGRPASKQFTTPSSTYITPSYTDPHGSYTSNPHSSAGGPPGMSNVERWEAPPPVPPPPQHWTGPPIAEMDSPAYGHSPEMPSHDNRWSNIYPRSTDISNPSNG